MDFSSKLLLAICRLGFIGKLPMAGTCTSAVAVLLAPFIFLPFGLFGRLLILDFVFFFGVWASARAEILLNCHDPREAVLDEVFGMWLTFLPFTEINWQLLLAGFILFRIFDIFKPGPIGAMESLPGGWGIMLDDGLAAVFACLILAILRYFQIV